MTATTHKIGCYWWATINCLVTECGHNAGNPVEWPRSGTNCKYCGQIMAYAANAADAEMLHDKGHDITYRHKVS